MRQIVFVLVFILCLVVSPALADSVSPVITGIKPVQAFPGKPIVISGENFVQNGVPVSTYKVLFLLPSRGVNWVSPQTPGVSWYQSSIWLKLPENLPAAATVDIVVFVGSASNHWPYKLGGGIYLPLLRGG